MEKVESSYLQKLVKTIEIVAERKVTLSKKKEQVLEAKKNKKQRMVEEALHIEQLKAQLQESKMKHREEVITDDDMRIERLENEWGMLETEINWLENIAKVLRQNLAESEVVTVSSVNEMKVMNELRLNVGAGAGPDVPCFTGTVYVPGLELPTEVVEGIQAADKTRETF